MSKVVVAGTTKKKRPSKGAQSRPISSMNYIAALKWLNDRINFERQLQDQLDRRAFKLDRMRALLGAMGDPQHDFKSVHVAGSKGKGSVVEMLSAMFGGCGYAVGVYTSPHLVHERERVRIGHEPISQTSFAHAMNHVRVASESIPAKLGEPSYFEVLTAAAFDYFAEKAVDLAVVETGLGGRLDATNLIEPEACVITGIQLEHTHVLGDTLGAIAREKAGIFKPGVPAITLCQDDDAMASLREVAERVGAPLSVLGEDIGFTARFVSSHDRGPHMRVTVSTERNDFEHLAVPLIGEHQAENCGLALAVADRLNERGFEVNELELVEGLERTARNGRGEVVLHSPRIIVDGAHTRPSMRALVESLGSHIKYDSVVVVFGCARDKDCDGMLAELARGADKVIFTRATDSPRAADPARLQKMFAEHSTKMTQVEPTLKDAINAAARAIDRGDLICVTGSFYLAGEAKGMIGQMLERKGNKGGAS